MAKIVKKGMGGFVALALGLAFTTLIAQSAEREGHGAEGMAHGAEGIAQSGKRMGAEDVDGDGQVTLGDMEVVLISIRDGAGPESADVNRDGRVDLEDLDLITQAYHGSGGQKTRSK